MPRRARLRLAGVPFHVIHRGNNRSACFFRSADYERYREDLRVLAHTHGVDVHAYVLMTNHVHLLMTPRESEGIGLVMKAVAQRHTQHINRTYRRSGSLWEGRFRSSLVDSESYLLQCHRYIECNPVRAVMVRNPGAYRWSSYRANALGAADPLLTPHPCVTALGCTPADRRATYGDLFLQELQPELVAEIRACANGGFVLGSDRFKLETARTLGRFVERQKRGPKTATEAE